MKKRRILIWTVIVAVAAGSAIAFLSYKFYIAKRKYASTDGGFSLLLPRGCESPTITPSKGGPSLWLWFCQDSTRVLIFKQPWEDIRREVIAEATKKSGKTEAPPTELVEVTAASFLVGKYFEAGGPCVTRSSGGGNFGTREFNNSTRELTVTKVEADGRHNAYHTSPIEWECSSVVGRDTVNLRIMVLFAGTNLYEIILDQSNVIPANRWDEIIQSFRVL